MFRSVPIILSSMLLAAMAFGADNDLEKRVEALEIASYTNTIKWSGSLETRYEEGTLKPSSGETVKRSVNSMIGGLNFQASLSDRVSVFGRVVYSSMYNGAFVSDTESSPFAESRSFYDAKAYFERFFANIQLVDNLYFTFGRLPTLDGPPYHFADSLPRQGAYPKWIFPATLDGYALTYSLKLSEASSLATRAIFSPLTCLVPSPNNADFKYVPQPNTGQDETGAVVSVVGPEKAEANAIMLDYNNSSSSFAKNLNVIVMHLNVPKMAFQGLPFIALNYKHQLAYVEANSILGSGLSAWVTYSMTDLTSKGFLTVKLPDGSFTPISGLAYGPNGSGKGKGLSFGVNYALPIHVLKDPSLGGEYVKNDEKYMLFDQSPGQMFDLYGVRGQASHVYWSQPLFDGIKLRIGTMMLNPTYTAGAYGAPMKLDDKMSSVYANLRLDF